jgi:CRISPR-associated exonuclease Cas4
MLLVILVAILVALGLLLLWLADRRRAASGLPEGRIVYIDTGGWQRPERPLFSNRLLLTGKPDYLVNTGDEIIPVEVKPRCAPDRPYASHVLQLAAYCLLVEEAYGRRPTHGIIKYDDLSFQVDYGPVLEEELFGTLSRMRDDLAAGNAPRRHNDRYRCKACGHREQCNQRLI